MTTWLESAPHRRWLEGHGVALLHFARRTGRPEGGAYWLDTRGVPDPAHPVLTWITARTLHVFSLGALLGVPGAATVAGQALRGLTGPLRDEVHGGWHPAFAAAPGEAAAGPVVGSAAGPVVGPKSCYDHVHVMLGAAGAAQAGLDGGRELLAEACAVFLTRFWDEAAGMCRDEWDPTFTTLDPYRGINANMHGVEAMLSVASLTGDAAWLVRAERVSSFLVASAAGHDWRIPEHYDADWRPLFEFNRDQPGHQFKPYGATVGHAFEWARLLLHLEGSGVATDTRFADAAAALFDRAVADGWSVDGEPGFVYTTDWNGAPVVRDRMHWVLTEAINAAAVLYRRTGEERYARWYATWWDHADAAHLDHEHGSWIMQLDEHNRPAADIWSGKPDTYHAFQTTLVPRLPVWPMMAAAVAEGAWL